MNHQYWITKNAKKLQRKFNAKEDDNIVHSDLELDGKLELFKSIHESTSLLANIVEKYRDALHSLSNETSNLGDFLKDCGKNSNSSSSVMINAGKVVSFLGQQHYTAMTALSRTLQELSTFKRAVVDSKETIQAMEKERTEYRASLALMKNCSQDIDPDSARGLEKFRKSQKYVKFAKQKFDKNSLACLQKIDLLSAARCNLFSYSLAAYQTNWLTLSEKNKQALDTHIQIIDKDPRTYFGGGSLKVFGVQETDDGDKKVENEASKLEDNDQKLFFDEFADDTKGNINLDTKDDENKINEKLIDDDEFDEFISASNANHLLPSQLLMDSSFFNVPTNADLLSSLVPTSQTANISGAAVSSSGKKAEEISLQKNPSKKINDVSKWFELFSELDPLNQQKEVKDANENLHAA